MEQKEILKTINDLLSLTKDDKEYNDAWDKGYELFKLISKKQLIITNVVGQSEQLVCPKCGNKDVVWTCYCNVCKEAH